MEHVVDWEKIAGRLADMARDLLVQESVQATLDRIADHAVALIDGCDAAGILVVRRRQVQTIAATDDVVRASDRLQGELQTGPCFDATEGKHMVYRIADTAAPDSSWPRYTAVARRLDIGSVMGFLLFTTDSDNLGALNLYSRQPSTFTDSAERIGLMLASHAAVALASARQAANLEIALESSRAIGEAIGILMARHRVPEAAAFDMLVRASQTSNTKVRDIATEVARTGAVPGPP